MARAGPRASRQVQGPGSSSVLRRLDKTCQCVLGPDGRYRERRPVSDSGPAPLGPPLPPGKAPRDALAFVLVQGPALPGGQGCTDAGVSTPGSRVH